MTSDTVAELEAAYRRLSGAVRYIPAHLLDCAEPPAEHLTQARQSLDAALTVARETAVPLVACLRPDLPRVDHVALGLRPPDYVARDARAAWVEDFDSSSRTAAYDGDLPMRAAILSQTLWRHACLLEQLNRLSRADAWKTVRSEATFAWVDLQKSGIDSLLFALARERGVDPWADRW